MRFAEDGGFGVSRMEDIILVTGRHLARSWARAVFSESRGGEQASFCVGVSGDSVVRLEERNVSGAQLKFGPNGKDLLPENQCIFVRGYHVVRVLNIWPRLRAMAGPASGQHEPEPESDTRLQLMGVPTDAEYQDPLHTLMEYIAEKDPACDMVLVHDDDLSYIKYPKPETMQPDALMQYFRAHPPMIHQFQYDLSPRNKSESEAKVALIGTIWTAFLEAPRLVRRMSRSISTSKTTSRGFECFTEGLDAVDGQDEHLIPHEKYDTGDLFETQAYTQRRAPLNAAASTSSFQESSQGPSTVRFSTLSAPPFLYPKRHPSISFGGPIPKVCLNDLAFTKLMVHAFKYPYMTVNGLLLGKHSVSDAPIDILDAGPVLHYQSNFTPGWTGDAEVGLMDLGLAVITDYAHSRQLDVVGFYEAPACVGPTATPAASSRVCEKVIAKMKKTDFQQTDFPTPIVLVLDRSRLTKESGAALFSYIFPPSSLSQSLRVEYNLISSQTVTRVLQLIRHTDILNDFWDFNNYIENNQAPFLTNDAVEELLKLPE